MFAEREKNKKVGGGGGGLGKEKRKKINYYEKVMDKSRNHTKSCSLLDLIAHPVFCGSPP